MPDCDTVPKAPVRLDGRHPSSSRLDASNRPEEKRISGDLGARKPVQGGLAPASTTARAQMAR
eukprot:6497791-Karenia_brevis.AAC.1